MEPKLLEIEELEAFPAGDNPFWHDPYRMGQNIGGEESQVMAMYLDFDPSEFVIMDVKTGRRFQVKLPR